MLNGMRTPACAEDSLTLLGWKPLPDVHRTSEAVKQVFWHRPTLPYRLFNPLALLLFKK